MRKKKQHGALLARARLKQHDSFSRATAKHNINIRRDTNTRKHKGTTSRDARSGDVATAGVGTSPQLMRDVAVGPALAQAKDIYVCTSHVSLMLGPFTPATHMKISVRPKRRCCLRRTPARLYLLELISREACCIAGALALKPEHDQISGTCPGPVGGA